MNVNMSQVKVCTVLNTVLFTVLNPVCKLERQDESTFNTLRFIT